MASEGSERRLQIDRQRLLFERLRLVAWVSLVATPIFFVVEAVSRPTHLGARTVLVSVQFAVLAVLLVLLRQPWLQRRVTAASLVMTIDMAIGTVVSGFLRQDVEVTSANLLLLVLGCAILLPWGLGAQAVLGLIAILGLAVNFAATEAASPTVPMVAGLGCALSVLVAHVLERGRTALAGEIIERRAAEEELRQARDELEVRVAERTESLAGANQSLATANARLEKEVEERRLIQLDLERARATAEAGSRAKSEFLSTVSHELRTPMNVILGMNEFLRDSELSGEQREWADAVDTAGQALLDLINNVLDVAGLDGPRPRLQRADFDLRMLAAEVMQGFAAQAKEKNLNLRLEIGDEVANALHGAADRIRQVLNNFIGNALKFTARGEIVLRVTTERVTETGPVVRFEVTDTGVGIRPDQLPHLFQPFWQADMSLTRAYGGSGVGLAICRRLAEMMNGEVGAFGTPGHGSTFWLVVSLRPAGGATAAVAQSALSEPTGRPLGKACVLVVEDEPLNRLVIVRMLEKLGFQVEVACNGREAIEWIEQRSFAAILMDCQMPVLDGLEATRRIRDIEGHSGRRTPIIAVTAGAMGSDRDRFLALGMDDYVAKPVTFVQLSALLGRWASPIGAGRH